MSDIFPRLEKNLQLPTGIEGPSSVKAVEAFKNEVAAKFSTIPLGKHLLTEVLAKLNDGTYLSNIDGLLVRLNLPKTTQVGDKLHLSLLQLSPRPTFVLDGSHQMIQVETPHKFEHPSLETAQRSTPIEANEEQTNSSTQKKNPDARSSSEVLRQPINAIAGDKVLHTKTNLLPAESKAVSATKEGPKGSSETDIVTISQQARRPVNESANLTHPLTNTSNPTNTTNTFVDAYIENNKFTAPQHVQVTESSSETELSTTGKLINALLIETTHPNEALSIENKQALVDRLTLSPLTLQSTTALADHIEKLLHEKISHSGLFYESHVAQWLQGKTPIEQLRSEPQAQLALSIEDSVLSDAKESAHVPLAKLVHQQLDVFEQQKIQLSGMLTPAVPFQWQIEKDSAFEKQQNQDDNHSSEATQSWHSKLSIALPQLGKITIDIQLSALHLQVDLKGSQFDAITLLQGHRTPLNDALHRVGPAHQSLRIVHDGNT